MAARSLAPDILVETDRGDSARPDVVWLDNAILRLGFVPALGGRLLSIRLHGRETLWRNTLLLDDSLYPRGGHVPAPVSGQMSDWNNYGGDKTWPAPQGWSGATEWAGPPDPVLDSGSYDWDVTTTPDSVTLTMVSGHDPRTGLTLTRAMTLHQGCSWYDTRLCVVNTSSAPVRWALWNVTQRTGGEPGIGGVAIGVEQGDHRGIPLAVGTGVPRFEVRGDARVLVPHQDVVGKVGFPGATGWLAHNAHGVTATQQFTIDPDGDYPDGGSRVEVWMEHPLPGPIAHLGDLHPHHRIVETEVLGPTTALDPMESSELGFRSGVVDGGSEVIALTPVGHWAVGNRFGAYTSGEIFVDGVRTTEVCAGTTTTIEGAVTGRTITLREHRSGTEHDLGRMDQP